MGDEKVLSEQQVTDLVFAARKHHFLLPAEAERMQASHELLRQRVEELERECGRRAESQAQINDALLRMGEKVKTYRELQAAIPTPDPLEGMRKWMEKRMDLDNNSQAMIIYMVLPDKIKAYRSALDKLKGTE